MSWVLITSLALPLEIISLISTSITVIMYIMMCMQLHSQSGSTVVCLTIVPGHRFETSPNLQVIPKFMSACR